LIRKCRFTSVAPEDDDWPILPQVASQGSSRTGRDAARLRAGCFLLGPYLSTMLPLSGRGKHLFNAFQKLRPARRNERLSEHIASFRHIATAVNASIFLMGVSFPVVSFNSSGMPLEWGGSTPSPFKPAGARGTKGATARSDSCPPLYAMENPCRHQISRLIMPRCWLP
jgi:hypothetical protein